MSRLELLEALADAWEISPDEFPESGTPAENLTFLLRYAVLAPSSHNSQPWLFRVRESYVDLYADRARALPVVDPEDRDLLISCGAALFELCIAMRHFGYEAGENWGRSAPTRPPITLKRGAQFFPETGHNLSGPFLNFWNDHGGLEIFGYQVSEELSEVNPLDGKEYTVQYFERSRFELHPQVGDTTAEVHLGLLGAVVLGEKSNAVPSGNGNATAAPSTPSERGTLRVARRHWTKCKDWDIGRPLALGSGLPSPPQARSRTSRRRAGQLP